MIEKKDDFVRLTDQERELGRSLARGIAKGAGMTDCPSTERLAEFIDGTLPSDSSADVTAHLADCETCFAVVSDSLTVRAEMARRARARRARYLAYAVPAGLATAAVLLLVFRTWQPPQEFTEKQAKEIASRPEPARPVPQARGGEGVSEPRSYAGDLAGRIMRQSTTAPLAAAGGKTSRPRTAFGFSSAVPPDKAAVRIGMCLARLEAARQAKDTVTAEAAVQQLAELLKPMKSSYGPVPPAVGRGSKDGTSVPGTDRFAGVSASVEAMFNLRQEALYLRFGAWIEAAGLAAEVRDAAFFSPAEIQAFSTELRDRNEPVGTLKDLSRLGTIIASGTIQPDQFQEITRLLADIREMY